MFILSAAAHLTSSLEGLDDETLVGLSQQGDLATQEALIRRFERLVRLRVRAYFLPGGEREDLHQEGLLGLVKAIRDYRPDHGSSFRAFADLCISRQIITAIKTATRQKHAALNLSRSLDAPLGPDGDGHCLLDTLNAAPSKVGPLELRLDPRSELLQQAREILSPYEFTVLRLYAAGLSYEEISQRLGKTRKSVDSAVFKVKHKLRRRALEVA